MKTLDQIRIEANKTHDPSVLYQLVFDAIAVAEFHAAQHAFSKKREEKLKSQVQRQSQMITDLENTLWKK